MRSEPIVISKAARPQVRRSSPSDLINLQITRAADLVSAALLVCPSVRRVRRAGSGIHRIEELGIALRLLELCDEEFHPIGDTHRHQDTSKQHHLPERDPIDTE